jgi:adenine-specific DNA methylase
MATTKATLVTRRIAFIEAALARLERELENAEGSHKETLRKWVVAIHEALKKHGRLTVH